ncbi:DUF305 domain-containing protein [Arthrobacter sp. ATA002]|uniref:DUF305 domain-containing protein n=1 Tax=Arthrobacter sp. ATA002 TaxID=2991715 RepID=UPI0022A7986A|nr:DUF305 domain-containing protein [Arthrobacter sp. ATA002]WAP50570.1 DUF305 domain-containing protein [Arthrobacter sp. ATA002]
MKRSSAISATTLAAVVFLASCGTDTGTDAGSDAGTDTGTEQAGGTPGMGHGRMSHGPSAGAGAGHSNSGHNSADTMFAQMMIVHHQQAMEMSDIVLAKDGLDPEIVQLAENIKAAQAPEIETMNTWLRNWGEPAHVSGEMPMDGMVNPEGLAQLQAAQGAEAARLFLIQMIAHHEGAIAMAEEEVSNGSAPEAVELARSVISEQEAEITDMDGLLAAL